MCVRYTCTNDRRCISSQGCPGVKRVDKTAGPHHDPPASIRWGHPLQRSFCSCEGMLLPHAARLEKQGKGRGASTPRRPHTVPDRPSPPAAQSAAPDIPAVAHPPCGASAERVRTGSEVQLATLTAGDASAQAQPPPKSIARPHPRFVPWANRTSRWLAAEGQQHAERVAQRAVVASNCVLHYESMACVQS